MRVNGLPSAVVSLNLQNCPELKILTSLSKLQNLKYLNINDCCNLKTLNMEGVASMEEFKAEGCWDLQSIEGLNICFSLHPIFIHAKTVDIFCANQEKWDWAMCWRIGGRVILL